MNDELPSESTRQPSSRRSIQSTKSATRNSAAKASPTTINKKTKLTTTETTTITIKSPVVHRRRKPKAEKQLTSTQKKRKKNQRLTPRTQKKSRISNSTKADNETENSDVQIENKADSDSSSNNDIVEETQDHVNTSDSFDSSQTTDIEDDQQVRKTTNKSKYDVLKYFTKTDNGDFVCNLCEKKSKVFPKSSVLSDTNLRSHLGRAHELDGFLYPSQMRKYPRTEEKISLYRKRLLDSAAIDAIIHDSHAFNLFQKDGMKKFLAVATPGYKGPSRRTVVKRLKPMYKRNRLNIRQTLSTVSDVSLSIDCWLSNRRSHFLCITGHYYDDEYHYHSLLITFRRFHGKHLSDRLERFVAKELEKFDLTAKVCAITCDNGSDIRSAATRLSKFGIKISCMLHNFNLIVQNGLWLFKIPKTNMQTSNSIHSTNCNKTTEEYTAYSSDDEYSVTGRSQEIGEISRHVEICNTSEDESISDTETTTTASSSSVESDFSSSNDSSDEDDAQQLPRIYTEEEKLVEAANNDPNILLSKIHLLMKLIRKLISIIVKSSILNRYVETQIKLKHQVNESQSAVQRPVKHKGFILDMRIRWGSSYKMISRFLYYSTIINGLTHDPTTILGLTSAQCRTLQKLSFSSTDWSILKSVENILSRFQHATKVLSTRSQPTLSLSHLVVHALTQYLTIADDVESTFENILRKHLLLTFNFYYDKHVTKEQKLATLVAAFLNPSTYALMDDCDRQQAETILLSKEFIQRMNFKSKSTQSSIQPTTTTTNDKQENDTSSNSLCNLYESCGLLLKSVPNNMRKWTMKEEICYYVSTSSAKQNFTNYWNHNKSRLPLLSSVVRRFNVISATAMPSESTFSKSGYVQRKNRSSLSPEILRYSMILKN